MKKLLYILLLALPFSAVSQTKSAKRGIGWDEKYTHFGVSHAEKINPGVSWIYNWGNAPKEPDVYSEGGIAFAPMNWNRGSETNLSAIRNYVKTHPETKYLLGYNEPNFSSQASITPALAAAAWPKMEALAEELGLKLVAPALNFSGEKVGGRTWNPYEWLDEFLKEYPDAHFDCLALHCYMNWYSSNTWFATEYFYKDLYNPAKKDVYGKYPHIVASLDAYKAAHGHFPRMMLTEFCAWEYDGNITKDFQIDQMTQKLQKLEQSDLVEGYAWFMGNAGNGYDAFPYMSIFRTNTADSELSDLGKIYVHMSSFDTDKYYLPGEKIMAKDYVDATTDAQQIKLRPNSEAASDVPLQVQFPASGWTEYQLDVPSDGEYEFTLRVKSSAAVNMTLYLKDGTKFNKLTSSSLASTSDAWADRTFKASLTAGKHNIALYPASAITVSSFKYEGSSALAGISVDENAIAEIYDLRGISVGSDLSSVPAGIYIFKDASGNTSLRLVKNEN